MNAPRSGCPINPTLEDGGPKLWSEFMQELRHLHLEAPAPKVPVFSRLQSAYESAIAKPLVSAKQQPPMSRSS